MKDKQQQDNDGGKSSGISQPKQQSADMGSDGSQSVDGSENQGASFANIDDDK